MIKSIYENPTSSIQNGEIFNVLALKSRKKQGCILLSRIFNIVLDAIVSIKMQGKKKKQHLKCWGGKKARLPWFIGDIIACIEIPKGPIFFKTLICTWKPKASYDTFLGYSLYKGGLEQNPQYFLGMLVCRLNFLTTKKIISSNYKIMISNHYKIKRIC